MVSWIFFVLLYVTANRITTSIPRITKDGKSIFLSMYFENIQSSNPMLTLYVADTNVYMYREIYVLWSNNVTWDRNKDDKTVLNVIFKLIGFISMCFALSQISSVYAWRAGIATAYIHSFGALLIWFAILPAPHADDFTHFENFLIENFTWL